MDKGPIEVVTLDSESEDDDIQIVSEKITNYGNYPTPVEITTELQEKIRQSIENYSGISVKIKTINVFASNNTSNGRVTVTASYKLANATKVINICPDLQVNFANKVQGALNYNSGNKRKPAHSLDKNSEKPKMAKCLSQPISNDPKHTLVERPSPSSRPVILFSPIRKIKQSRIRRGNLQKKRFHQNLLLQNLTPLNQPIATALTKFDLPPEKSEPPHQNNFLLWQNLVLPPQISSISSCQHDNLFSQFCQQSQFLGEKTEHQQDLSQINVNKNENISLSRLTTHDSLSQMIIPDLDPLLVETEHDVFEDVSTNFSKTEKLSRVAFSPMMYGSDGQERSTNINETENINSVAFSPNKYVSDNEEGSTNVNKTEKNEKLNSIAFEKGSTYGSETEKLKPIECSPVKYSSDDEEVSTNNSETEKVNPIAFSPIKYSSDDGERSTNASETEKLNPIAFSSMKYASDDEEGCTNIDENEKLNPVACSPMKYTSSDDKGFIENSMLAIWSSPISSSQKCLNGFPKSKSEQESLSKAKEFYRIDTTLEDVTKHTSWELLSKQETRQNTKRKSIDDHEDLINHKEQKKKENENEFFEVDTPKQDVDTVAKLSMSLKVDIKCLPKNMILELAKQESYLNKKTPGLQANGYTEKNICSFPLNRRGLPPLWTTNFPPNPPSPPPPGWYGSTHLWQLDEPEFVSMTSLCRNEDAAEMRQRVHAPKPLVRVLRQRPKKTEFDANFLTD